MARRRTGTRLIHKRNELKFDEENKKEVLYLDKSFKKFKEVVTGSFQFTSAGIVPEIIKYSIRYVDRIEQDEDFIFEVIPNIHTNKYKYDGWPMKFQRQLDNKLAYSLSIEIVPHITGNFYLFINDIFD